MSELHTEIASAELAPHPKGINPGLLIEKVFNTAPFLANLNLPREPRYGYAALILDTQAKVATDPAPHFLFADYFALLVAAHFTSAATLVPTDVDNTIREKLWLMVPTKAEFDAMVDFVFEVTRWDMRPISQRWVASSEGEIMAGHAGEFLGLLAAAYGTSRRRMAPYADAIQAAVVQEIEIEIRVYESLQKERRPLEVLKATAVLAHNLGDLVRVIETFGLPPQDPLRAYVDSLSISHEKHELFERAALLYKNHMALENHRHLPLRAARSLRKAVELIIPFGPFLDDWGKTIGRHPILTDEDVSDICYHLIEGWERLAGPIGYARALRGIEENYPGGREKICKGLPSRAAKKWRSGPLRLLCDIPQPRFEAQWASYVKK